MFKRILFLIFAFLILIFPINAFGTAQPIGPNYDDAILNYSATGLEVKAPLSPTYGGTGVTGLGANVANFLTTPSSANLAAAVTDGTGSGALVFGTSPTITTPVINHNVTAKTTTATLNIAESGLITATAASGYTILLPTAVGNSGIVFIIKKTDDNTNLITIDGNDSETIDGELTYTDLNYQYAYIIIISDNSNWLVIGESTVKGGTF